jgi:hypothetical protein
MSSSYLESPVSALNRPDFTALGPFPQNLTCLLAGPTHIAMRNKRLPAWFVESDMATRFRWF